MNVLGGVILLTMLVLIRPIYLLLRRKINWYKRCESYIERRLYTALTNKEYYAETQIRCGAYRIDITLPEYDIAIECDGMAYHSSLAQKKHDAKKNRYLRKNGWYVMRFTGKDICSNLPQVIEVIENTVFQRVNNIS